MIINAIKHAFKRKEEKKWDVIYGAIDIHRTVVKPDYDNKFTFEYYPYAKETLQLMCKIGSVKLIMFTCSFPSEIEKYLKAFSHDNINFTHVNENPDVSNCEYGCFDTKWHFDFLMDDKSGFDATSEWEGIYDYFLRLEKESKNICPDCTDGYTDNPFSDSNGPQACNVCNGTGKLICSFCNGSGKDYADKIYGVPCPSCDGDGY